MQRQLSTWSLLCIAVSAIVGSGWLFGPLYAARLAGPAAMIAWLLGGGMVLVVAMTFAELSTMWPMVGGLARFPQLSHGTLVSFAMGWLLWLSYVLTPPVEVLALVQYASNYWPDLITSVGQEVRLSGLGLGVASVLLALITLFNVLGVRLLSRVNNGVALLKILIPIVCTAALMVHGRHVSNFTAWGFAPSGWQGVLEALPRSGIVFSFFGFNLAIAMGGEVRNPQRAIPWALAGSLGICTLLYLCLQANLVASVPPVWLAHGWSQLHFPGEAGPFVGLALLAGLWPVAAVLYLDAFVSPYGSALVISATNARINYAMSKNGYFPRWFQKSNAQGSPYAAVCFNTLLGVLLLFPFPNWQRLAEFILAALVLSHTVVPICVMCFRHTLPDTQRPFRLPCARAWSWLAFVCLSAMLYWAGWTTYWKMLLALGVGMAWLVLQRVGAWRWHGAWGWRHSVWMWAYILGMGVISAAGRFEGGWGWLPVGWDMLVLVVWSTLMFQWGVRSGRDEVSVRQAVQDVMQDASA